VFIRFDLTEVNGSSLVHNGDDWLFVDSEDGSFFRGSAYLYRLSYLFGVRTWDLTSTNLRYVRDDLGLRSFVPDVQLCGSDMFLGTKLICQLDDMKFEQVRLCYFCRYLDFQVCCLNCNISIDTLFGIKMLLALVFSVSSGEFLGCYTDNSKAKCEFTAGLSRFFLAVGGRALF